MSTHADYDFSEWPVLRVTYPKNITKEVIEDVFQKDAELWARRQPYVSIMDMRKGMSVGARERKLSADHITAHRDDIARFCKACAFVVNSKFQRGALTAVFWVTNFPVPRKSFDNLAAARKWAKSHL